MYINYTTRIYSIVLLLLFLACDSKNKTDNQELVTSKEVIVPSGIVNELVDASVYDQVIYVNKISKAEMSDGSKESPFSSVANALKNVKGQHTGILVAMGEYEEETLVLKEGIDLFGGFDPTDWSRNISNNATTLSGRNERRIIVGANNSRIDGFIITQGRYRGMGGAIYCNGTSPTISNNVFSSNMVLGPLNWKPEFWHETAHNGGAVYGEKGASPIIKNNVFINNKTENGRGAAVAFDNKCKVVINNNVFINNIAGTNDPMRSSDGGAISIFDWCEAEISNNLFLGNKALARNDGGAVFVALWSSATISNNILVDSESGDDAGALFVGGQEHRYGGAPLDPIPPKDKFYVIVDNNQFYGNRNSSLNSGAMRYTMESRGEFTNNKLALNNGVYFQRSEVAVKDNVIFDNFLFIETKEGLKQGSIENNVIWGDFELTTPAKVTGNMIRDGYEGGEGNFKGIPAILDDGKQLNIASITVNRKKGTSHLYLSNDKFQSGELVNRVVRNGNKWGIIQSNTGAEIKVWGDLYGVESIQLLPSYTVIK